MDKEIHASMIGSLCDRAIYYHTNNFEQSVQEKSRRVLETGSMFESLVINWLRQDYSLSVSFNPLISGAKKGELKLSIPVKGGNIIGRPDCFINGKEIHNVLIDIKSMNSRSFSRWKRLGSVEDKPGYVDQLHVYALGARNIGIKVESLGIVGVNKDNSDMHIDLFDFNNERMNKIIKRSEFIFSCDEAPEPGKRLQDWSCSYCPYSTICEIAQSKKNTEVGKSVSVTDDKDVISAMELLQESREMERDAKELEALAKETLDKKVRLQGLKYVQAGELVLVLKEISSARFDTAAFKKSHPDLVKDFIKTSTSVRYELKNLQEAA